MKRKKRLLSLLMCAALILSFIPVKTNAAGAWDGSAAAPSQGAGSSGDPYQISTAEELAWFAGQVNGGNAGICAVLIADIILNDTTGWAHWATTPPANTWTPIGNSTSRFTGSFDGNSYTVGGIYVGSGTVLGLFGYVGAGGNIQNVIVIESYICGSSTYSYVGGICGRNNGGGITGCYNYGTIAASGNYAGGICGQNNIGSTTGCYNYGTVVTSGNYTGGICGESTGTVTGCYNYGTVQGTMCVGGICGVNVAGGTVSGCGNTGGVTGTDKFAGGVCGGLSAATEPRAKIMNCFNTGTVQGIDSGGINGSNTMGSISGCYFLSTLGVSGVGNNYQGSVDATGKSADSFASGEVAYLLGSLFGQTLGTDQTPAARSADDRNAVYKLTYLNGTDEHAIQYYNNGNSISDVHVPIPTGSGGEYFWEWDNLPDAMPDRDVTATAVFGAAIAPSIVTTSLRNAVVGSGYLELIQAEGSKPVSYSVISGTLHPGLSLDADTGEITGTPVTGGTFTFTLQAENTAGSDTQQFSITVKTRPVITTTSPPSGTVGVLYSAEIDAEGIPPAEFTVAAGNLPAGLSLDAASGIISGTPTASGTNTFTIKAENIIGSDTRELSITIKKAEPSIMTLSLPAGTLGAPYSAEIEAEGKPPFTFEVSTGTLPAGLSLDAVTGIISGTPIATGSSTFTIQAKNDAGEDSRELSIEISGQPPGSGTSGDPYQIFMAGQLIWFADQVNSGRQNIHAVLMADIALNETSGWENWSTNPPLNSWTPIGINIANRFIGSFNGNNHTISGVYINSSEDYQGLFGYAGISTIQNVKLTQSYIKGKGYVGGICGSSFGTVFNNNRNTGTIIGTDTYVGGMCGVSNTNNTIQSCHNTGTITGAGITGGISGGNNSIIIGCSNAGTICNNGTGTQFGGICGTNYDSGSIIDSCNTGVVNTSNNNNVGGICGFNLATITNAYNTGIIIAKYNYGMICGLVPLSGTITNCYYPGTTGGIGNHMGSGTATGKIVDAFTSGEIAYLLGTAFGQTLGTDLVPVFRASDNSNAVFKLTYLNGADEHAAQYYNSGSTVSADVVSNPTSGTGIFTGWEGLPAVMPANNMTVTASFTAPAAVELISATADGSVGAMTSTKIDLIFDTSITNLTADNITITDGSGSAVKGVLTGSGTTWSIALASVTREGDVSLEISAPVGYTISGTPKTVTVYKQILQLSITTAVLDEATAGSPYSQTILYSYTGSGTLEFNASGLPSGLSINTGTGIISGIPDAASQPGSPYSVIIEVTDGSMTDSKAYSLTVNTAPVIDASISPDTSSFDIYSPDDINITITWNSAQSVTGVLYNSVSLKEGTEYFVNGDILTITKEYLLTRSPGTLGLTIVFDTGGLSVLTINIANSTPPCISPTLANYDLTSPAGISIAITWNSSQSVTGVAHNTYSLIEDTDYTVTGDIINIRESYLSSQPFSENEQAEFEITFDTGFTTILTIAIVNNYIPSSVASLGDLTVGGGTVNGFAPDSYYYDAELPYGTLPGSAAALVGATANDPLAQVKITQASVLPGGATVTVTAEDGTELVYTVHFTLGGASIVPVTSITVTGAGGISGVQVGKTLQMVADVLPVNATDKSVVWSIISGSGASISANGLLTATAPGSVIVRAAAGDGSGAYGEAVIILTAPPVTTHTITFISNGTVYAAITVNDGGNIGSADWPPPPARSGYTFGGWYTGTNGSGTLFTSSTAVNANITVYAKWTYSDGSGYGKSVTPSPTPVYKADVKAENSPETTLPITVNEGAGIAAIDTGSYSYASGRTVITVPSIPGVDNYSIGIPVTALSKPDGHGMLALSTDAGSITISYDMLTGISGINGNKAEITIGQGDKDNLPEDVKNAIGERPLIQIMLSIDSIQTEWNNPNVPVTISIPYTPSAAELLHPECIIIWYIDGSGNAVTVPNGRYDPGSGMVTFTTGHFSEYAVAYNKVRFDDVASDAWYGKAVNFIAARGITNGTGNGKYSPGAKLTRGEFIILVMRAYGLSPDNDPADNFSDADNTYYTGYLAAAKRLGISSGVGNNLYAPDKEITRQEMFALLYNTLNVFGKLPGMHGRAVSEADDQPEGDSGEALAHFTDAGRIDAWAKCAITFLVENGIISGNSGSLNPLATATRAEMAQMLYNLSPK